MSARNRLVWNMMLPVDDDVLGDGTDAADAFDAQLENQLARLDGLSLSSIEDDPEAWETDDDTFSGEDFLHRSHRFS